MPDVDKILVGLLGSALALVAVILIVSLITGVTNTVRDDALAGESGTNVINESVTWSNMTFVALNNSPSSVELTCATIYNNVSGTGADGVGANLTINSGNYTCTTGGINVSNWMIGNDLVNITTTLRVNYNYKIGDAPYNVSSEGITGMLNFSEQFGTIGTVVAILAIIGILATAFLFVRKKGEL